MVMESQSESYSGTAKEVTLNLSKGSKWNIREVRVSFANYTAGAKITLCRKDSATTANNRTPTHADSSGVWVSDSYLDNGDIDAQDHSNSMKVQGWDGFRSEDARLYLDLGANSGTVYITTVYDFQGSP
jgi:hypothetical protein